MLLCWKDIVKGDLVSESDSRTPSEAIPTKPIPVFWGLKNLVNKACCGLVLIIHKATSEIEVIREYEEQDLDDLLLTWEAASEIAHPFLTPEFMASVREDIPKIYLPNAETWVAEQGGRVVGFIALLGNEVGALFVHPDHHRKGIGRCLVDKARQLRSELVVEVFTANDIGRSFYAKYGFELVEEKVHEQTGFPLHRLRLSTV